MTITYQILITIIVNAVFIGIAYAKIIQRIDRNDERNEQNNKVLYGQAGALNVIDQKTCKENRDIIFSAIRKHEKPMEMILLELRELKEAWIEMRMRIEFINGIKKDQNKL